MPKLRAALVGLPLVCLAISGCLTSQSPPPRTAGKQATRGQKTAGDPEPDCLPIPSDLAPHITEAEALGREIYIQDKVNAAGTDELLAHLDQRFPTDVAGYVTFREADDERRTKDSWLVLFFTREQPARIRYRIRVFVRVGPRQTTFEDLNPPETATDELLSLIRARQTAIAAIPNNGQSMNSVVLPGDILGQGGVLVYLLAGTTDPNEIVLGRHFRVLVSIDGRTVEQLQPLSKTAIVVRRDIPPNARSVGVGVTHLVTDWPLETHVFASLLYRSPIYVGTARGFWRVKEGRIDYLSERKQAEAGAQVLD